MWKPCPQPISLERRESVSWTDLFLGNVYRKLYVFFALRHFSVGVPQILNWTISVGYSANVFAISWWPDGEMIEMIPSNPMGGKNATMINGESTMKVDHVLGEMCIDWVRSKIFSLHSSNDWFRSLSTWHDEFPFYPWCQMVPMFPIFLNEVVQVVLMLQMVPGTKKHWLNSWTNKLCPLQASFFEMVPSGYLTVRHGIDGPLK